MKIAHLGCTHAKHYNIPWAFAPDEADMIIHSGDLSNIGSYHDVEDFLEWFSQLPIKYKIFIAGNHDRTFDPYRGGNNGETPIWLKDMLTDFQEQSENNHYLENSGCEIEGIKIWGSPATPWFHGTSWAFNFHEHRILDVWEKIPKDIDILVTHGPVRGIHDFTLIDTKNVGCPTLAEKVKEVNPLLHLCSHIHEGYGYKKSGDTHYFNGSVLSLAYYPINSPWLIDADFTNRTVKILNEKYKSDVR
jgi:hypothetical protein